MRSLIRKFLGSVSVFEFALAIALLIVVAVAVYKYWNNWPSEPTPIQDTAHEPYI